MPTNPPATSQLREVPLAACRLDAGDITVEATADGKTPITLRARSGDPVNNWWWGRLVHDMSGLQAPKGSVPFDYCHDDDDVVGYGEKFDPQPDGLTVSGFLTSIEPNDRADEIAKKRRLGVPYQASIFFEPLSIEEVLAGGMAKVNGKDVQGPACVIRTWNLRGVAVCPYGNDPDTSADVDLSAKKLTGNFRVPLTHPKKMSTIATNPAPPDAAVQQSTPAATPAAAAPASSAPSVDPRAGFMSELKKFNDAFGPQGSVWLSEGKSFEEAALLHIKAQADKLTQKDTELAAANTKLGAVPRGEAAPVSMTSADPAPAGGTGTGGKPDRLSHLGSVGKFAQSIKLPGQK